MYMSKGEGAGYTGSRLWSKKAKKRGKKGGKTVEEKIAWEVGAQGCQTQRAHTIFIVG